MVHKFAQPLLLRCLARGEPGAPQTGRLRQGLEVRRDGLKHILANGPSDDDVIPAWMSRCELGLLFCVLFSCCFVPACSSLSLRTHTATTNHAGRRHTCVHRRPAAVTARSYNNYKTLKCVSVRFRLKKNLVQPGRTPASGSRCRSDSARRHGCFHLWAGGQPAVLMGVRWRVNGS